MLTFWPQSVNEVESEAVEKSARNHVMISMVSLKQQASSTPPWCLRCLSICSSWGRWRGTARPGKAPWAEWPSGWWDTRTPWWLPQSQWEGQAHKRPISTCVHQRKWESKPSSVPAVLHKVPVGPGRPQWSLPAPSTPGRSRTPCSCTDTPTPQGRLHLVGATMASSVSDTRFSPGRVWCSLRRTHRGAAGQSSQS